MALNNLKFITDPVFHISLSPSPPLLCRSMRLSGKLKKINFSFEIAFLFTVNCKFNRGLTLLLYPN